MTMFTEATGDTPFKRPFNPNSPDILPIKTFVPARQASVLAQLKTLGVE